MSSQEIRASLVNVNTSVIGKRSDLDLSTLIDPEGRKSALKEAQTERRDVYFDGKWKDTPIYWRDYLPADLHLEGPAIIEQMDCTTVLEPGDYAEGDADGQYHHHDEGAHMSIDPITLGVIQAGLQQVCDEMDLSFSRAAFSPVIAEANDRSDGIYSAEDGALIAQGAGGLPVFVGTMQYSTRT